MSCDPELLSDLELFEHLENDDRIRLAEVVDLLELPSCGSQYAREHRGVEQLVGPQRAPVAPGQTGLSK